MAAVVVPSVVPHVLQESAQKSPAISNACEWWKAIKILMHAPGEEISIATFHPTAALFEKFVPVEKAREEHRAYAKLLEDKGALVYQVVDVLLQGTDKPGKELEDLQELAFRSSSYTYSADFSERDRLKQEEYRRKVVDEMTPQELVRTIMLRPAVHLEKTGRNTGLTPTYSMSPMANTYFLRDQMITTEKGVVIGKMNSPQRAPETEVIKFVLNKMGIKPVCQIEGEGRLEGGDFIPADKIAFIGQGLRTNAIAIKQLIEQDAFGQVDFVAVVKDPRQDQTQMHLDTYFNIIDSKKAVLIETRCHEKGKAPEIATFADIYARDKAGKHTLVKENIDFVDYVKDGLGFDLIPVSNDDQLKYGVNFLTVESNKLLGIDGVSQEYKDRLKAKGVEVKWMDFRGLTAGYGAAHCTTQVLLREK